MQTEVLLRVNGRYHTAPWYKDIDKLSYVAVMDHDVLIDFHTISMKRDYKVIEELLWRTSAFR